MELVGFGRIWSDLVGFGWIWSDMVGFNVRYGRIWLDSPDFVRFAWIWSVLFGVALGRGPVIGAHSNIVIDN